MIQEKSFNSSQQVSIQTSRLLVKGNIMIWDGTMIQLSNISCISTAALAQAPFPMYALGLLGVGIIMLLVVWYISVFLLIFGGIWIYQWYSQNKEREKNTILKVVMNSGTTLRFIINNRDFLNKVLRVLEQIIIDGGVGKQSVAINIQGSTITGNAKVLNDLNIM